MAREPARPWHLYAVAAAIGLALYLIVYGPGHLLGTTPYWKMPFSDERQALIGYRYFLHEPWHWPLFLSDRINVPYPKSVAFLDCVPLWALANKMIATVVPPWASVSEHAYLGLWHAIVYALQACFGVGVLRALGHRSWRAGLVTALFFVSLPTWIFRYAHPGLSAHWIELWALWLYVRRRIGIAWPCQLAVAALVYPYHAVISLAVFVAALARTCDRRTFAIWLPLGLASVLAATVLVGYFAHETARRQWGFEFESANLLSWLVPVRSGIIGDARWIANVMGTDWQYEGYAYLGAGTLLLLAWLVPHSRSLREVIARHALLFACVCAFAVLALSNHIYFGSHEIISYPIPSFLRWIPNQFRSPGRFVWLPTYVLVAFLLHWGLRRRFAVVAVAAVLQMIDARGDWALQHANTRGGSAVLDIAAWRPLVHAHDAVVVLPPYSCRIGDDVTPLDQVSMDIEMLASERALPINGTYSARPWRRCGAEQKEWPTLRPRAGTLYVLLPPALGVADVLEAGGARCATFAQGRVCATDLEVSFLQPVPAPIALARGGELAASGWIDSPLATLRIAAEPGTLHIAAEAQLCGARQTQDVDVLVDGAPAGTLHFPGAAPLAVPGGRVITLELVPRDTRTPEQLGCGADARRFGVRVTRIWLD